MKRILPCALIVYLKYSCPFPLEKKKKKHAFEPWFLVGSRITWFDNALGFFFSGTGIPWKGYKNVIVLEEQAQI